MVSNNLDLLHASFLERLMRVLDTLDKHSIPLVVYEAYRTPERQAYLYAQGRTRPGNIVTYAKPFYSFHQYGMAVDMVFRVNGKLTWTEPIKGMWALYHSAARREGLVPLNFETPHIQWSGLTIGQLQAGKFPPHGGKLWEANLLANK